MVVSTIAIRLWVVGADTNAEADAALIASATRDVFFMVGSMRASSVLGILCGVAMYLCAYRRDKYINYVLLLNSRGLQLIINNFLW